MRKTIALLILVVLVPCTALADLTVYFLDVGQGDCAVIECDGEIMIIDGGLPGQSQKIYSFLTNELDFDRFVYMVATHPDNDHIGGLPAVFEAANKINKQVKYVYSPLKEFDSPRFTDLKNKADQYNLKIKVPYDEEEKTLGSATVVFYNCGRERKGVVRTAADWFKSVFHRDDPEEDKENNDISLVVKIIYKDTSFLFTGDIEEDAEKRLINSGYDLSADVLKIAHHGSKYSSSVDFLQKVAPSYAVISCGKGNRYKHPHQKTLTDLMNLKSPQNQALQLYRTDMQGMITCRSDGQSISFETEKTATGDLFTAPENE